MNKVSDQSKMSLVSIIFIISIVAVNSNCPIGIPAEPKVEFQSSNEIPGRIIGGSDARLGEFPWQVSLQYVDPSGQSTPFCGGSILSPTHILTAAHCLKSEDQNTIVVVAGAHNIFNPDGTEQRIRVGAWDIHEHFDPPTYDNDIAIIRLQSPLEFNSGVASIPLAADGFVPSGNCVNTGWGNIRNDGGVEYPEVLQKVTLQIVPRNTCEKIYEEVNRITLGMICAGDDRGNKGSCKGDSGGPLICRDHNNVAYLAGLVSWGIEPCALDGLYPSVFTNVAYYVQWIYGQK